MSHNRKLQVRFRDATAHLVLRDPIEDCRRSFILQHVSAHFEHRQVVMLLQQVPETHGSVLQHLKWSDSNLHPGNCERTELTCLMKFAVRSKCAIDNAEGEVIALQRSSIPLLLILQ